MFGIHTVNLSIDVGVGFLTLFGIASNDGIVMATYLDQNFQTKDTHPAVPAPLPRRGSLEVPSFGEVTAGGMGLPTYPGKIPQVSDRRRGTAGEPLPDDHRHHDADSAYRC